MDLTLNGYFSQTNDELKTPELWSPMMNVMLRDPAEPSHIKVLKDGLVALIDTGASRSCIDVDLAKNLNLPIYSKGSQITATEKAATNLYSISILLGGLLTVNVVCSEGIFRKQGSHFDLLLGMDAIRFCELTVRRSKNEVTLRYSS